MPNEIASPKTAQEFVNQFAPGQFEAGAASQKYNELIKQSGGIAPFTFGDVINLVPPSAPKTEVGMIDTSSAITQVNKQKGYLDQTYPVKPVTQERTLEIPKPAIQPAATITPATTAPAQPTVQLDVQQKALQMDYEVAIREVEDITRDFLSYNVDQDPDFQMQAGSIKAEFDKLRREMEKTNYQRQRAYETLGYRTGAEQYAGNIQMGIVGEEIRQGNERLAEISRQEALAMAGARSAFKTGKYTEFNQKVNALKDIREQKVTELERYNQSLADATNKLRENTRFAMEQQRFEMEKIGFGAELREKERTRIFEDIQNQINVGAELAPELKRQYEDVLGYQPGFIDAYVETQKAIQEADTIEKQLVQSGKVIDILSKIPENETIELPGFGTMTGLKEVDFTKGIFRGTETDEQGNVTEFFTRIDPKTGQPEFLGSFTIEGIGKPIQTELQKQAELLRMEEAQLSIEEKTLKINQLLNEMTTGTEGTIRLDNKEAAKLNKEIVTSDSYKAITSADDALRVLVDFEQAFKAQGGDLEFIGSGAADISSKYMTTLLTLKEYFNLGVLNGPDVEVMKQMLKDPTSLGTLRFGGGEAVQKSIDSMRMQIYNKMQEEYTKLLQGYNSYDPGQLTNIQNAQNTFSNFRKENADMIIKEMVKENPDLFNTIESIKSEYPNSNSYEMLEFIDESFNQVGSGTTQRLPDKEELKQLSDGETTLQNVGEGIVTGIDGSKLWKWGLDFVLSGGYKASVLAPLSGVVTSVVGGYKNNTGKPLVSGTGKQQNSGFGNQIKIKTDDGQEIWVSHLASVADLKEGQRISQGQIIGTQGNTGSTYGNTGVHLDITMKKPDGSYYTAREVAALLGDNRLKNYA